MPPGISLAEGERDGRRPARRRKEFPEVSHVVTHIGRNDDGTDPWTPSHVEAAVGLTPYSTWPSGGTKQDLVAA